jgi:hypothetical protein
VKWKVLVERREGYMKIFAREEVETKKGEGSEVMIGGEKGGYYVTDSGPGAC